MSTYVSTDPVHPTEGMLGALVPLPGSEGQLSELLLLPFDLYWSRTLVRRHDLLEGARLSEPKLGGVTFEDQALAYVDSGFLLEAWDDTAPEEVRTYAVATLGSMEPGLVEYRRTLDAFPEPTTRYSTLEVRARSFRFWPDHASGRPSPPVPIVWAYVGLLCHVEGDELTATFRALARLDPDVALTVLESPIAPQLGDPAPLRRLAGLAPRAIEPLLSNSSRAVREKAMTLTKQSLGTATP